MALPVEGQFVDAFLIKPLFSGSNHLLNYWNACEADIIELLQEIDNFILITFMHIHGYNVGINSLVYLKENLYDEFAIIW